MSKRSDLPPSLTVAAQLEEFYDVVVMGGSLAGASTAITLLKDKPDLRILIVEKSPKFTRRVGEATVEVSAYYLTRVLGLTQHLNHHHLVKQGLRFWFANDRCSNIADCSEIGGRYLARVPSFLIDRAVMDEELLSRVRNAGATVCRPGTVETVELQSGENQSLTIRAGGESREVKARWVVDASGVAAKLARQHGWFKPNDAHPTSSAWARWRGVKDLDGEELIRKYPEWAMDCFGTRGTATNHLMGEGWWAWIIPLKGDEVSVGIVMDQRLVGWPESGSVADRLKEVLCRHPVGRELLSDATWVEGDVHWRKHLPYSSATFAGDGFVLVGDAAGFLDPFYSPGMDWVTFTTARATDLILGQQRGDAVTGMVDRFNKDFRRSYDRWFSALYREKYRYLGEYDLMKLAFVLDLGCYYLGVAAQPYRRGPKALLEPVFSTAPSVPVYYIMKLYNRRFAQIARTRAKRGVAAERNNGNRFMFGGFTFHASSIAPIIRALLGWGWLELTEGWRSWFAGEEVDSVPVTESNPATVQGV